MKSQKLKQFCYRHINFCLTLMKPHLHFRLLALFCPVSITNVVFNIPRFPLLDSTTYHSYFVFWLDYRLKLHMSCHVTVEAMAFNQSQNQ